jgi:hypothetical protein
MVLVVVACPEPSSLISIPATILEIHTENGKEPARYASRGKYQPEEINICKLIGYLVLE